MKKILSLVLALVMVLGCMSVPAFAEENDKSGATTITANVVKPDVAYEIVIPQAVTMNEAGVKEIGAAKISTDDGDLKYATANTVISYTASGTDFKLSTNESKTMAATYYSAYTDKDTNTTLDSTKAIEVYKNSALVDPLTTLYVGVTQEVWDAAAMSNPGTYTATVTFNFSAEEKEEKTVTAADALIIGAQFRVTGKYGEEHVVVGTYRRIDSGTGFERVSLTEDNEDISETKKGYCELQEGGCICFADSASEENANLLISIYADSNKYDPTAGSFISFEVKPEGETGFTAVELTQAKTA